MLWLYNIGILFYELIIRVFASFNPKANAFIKGRKRIFSIISSKIDNRSKHIWFHFASLGEFEQGRPVLERIKRDHPEKKIVITFFSPSGYEIRKDYALAEAVFYLPLDTALNAKKFIDLINPELVVFTKYEFWYHYFKTLKDQNIPLYIISGIFRPNQVFFKWYGGFYRKILNCVTYFFVQNEESLNLLNSIELHNVSLSGDTRFDRVAEHAASPKRIEIIEAFCNQSPVFIAGSTWPQDENILINLIDRHKEWKFIIAPHEIGTDHLIEIEKLLPAAVKYSNLTAENAGQFHILLIDNIGLLSSVYQYGNIAYIGGGFGAGIHNTLEAAAFGLPLIFGPKYNKFQEAKDLIKLNVAISITNEKELADAFEVFSQNPQPGIRARKYVQDHKGATEVILNKLSGIFY